MNIASFSEQNSKMKIFGCCLRFGKEVSFSYADCAACFCNFQNGEYMLWN